MRLAYIAEDTYGTQKTGLNLQKMRITGESLKATNETIRSNEIRDDRQTAGIIRSDIGGGGPINFELSYGSFDDFLAAALMSENIRAQGTLTMDTNPIDANGDTITIGSITYRFKSSMAQANDVKIGATVADTQASLVKVINGTGEAGTDYYAGTTTPHPQVMADDFASDDCVITALAPGEEGNSIATTETFTAGTNVFDDATLGTTTAGAGWSLPVTVTAATISAASADNSFNDSGSGFGSIEPYQWIKASGFTNAANNGYFKVVSATSAKIAVSGGTLVNESSGTSRTIKQGSSITNGSTKNSFNIERTYTDLSNNLALFLGCMVNQLTLNVGLKAIVTGTMDILSKIESSETSSGGSGYDDVNTNKILNSIDDVVGVYENEVSVNILDFSMTVNNQLRERKRIRTLGTFDIGLGQLQLGGSFTAYYESSTLYDKFLEFTTTSLAKVFDDANGDGNAYVIDIPSVKVTDSQRHSGAGMGDDFKVPCTWEAFVDVIEGITIRIVKFAA
jgi:hypothetical protein